MDPCLGPIWLYEALATNGANARGCPVRQAVGNVATVGKRLRFTEIEATPQDDKPLSEQRREMYIYIYI